ncbi:MAG TPA: PorT family protein [Actinobacteria bacterium]|nr:PorT family protein [Actinomycetota bacterium]
MRLGAVVMGGLFAGLLVGAVPATAQIGIGPIGGISLANFSGADKDVPGLSRSGRTGFLVGGMVDIPLGAVSIRPEVFYVQKGARYSDSGGESGLDVDYIEIPALVVFGIPAGGIKVELFAGPQISFQAKCSLTATPTGGSTAGQDCPSDIIKGTDFGILFGGGVAVGSFMAQVAIDYGLTTIDAEADPDDIRNQAIYVLVGWMFRLN